ncbi:sulfite reductase [NADPH] flavoprotein component [[Candida] anglica]|uniref:Sulfite reductase [NADPH] flavoprotein component n=1 Tax=[Candida] anglica TaxID=148631 RepID=A0ABP0E8C4_9ASCO
MAPHAIASESASTAPTLSTAGGINNPFGTAADPHAIKGSNYTSADTIVSQAIYSISAKIFSYETPGSSGLFDSHLQLWSSHYNRVNSFGVVPHLYNLQVRSGASNAILGYFGKNGTHGQPLTSVSASNALSYMYPVLSSASARLPLSFNVSALDYDEASQSLVSNYTGPLSVARGLDYPVFTPVDSSNGLEIQHLTVLNHYLAAFTGRPSINLFDGPEYAKTFTKYSNLLSVDQLGQLYKGLLDESSSNGQVPSSTEEAVEIAFTNLNKLAGTSYSQFEYIGHQQAEVVFVVYGTYESTQIGQVIKKLGTEKVGLIQIRSPLPFNTSKFIATIPESARKLVILGQAASSISSASTLKADVTAALFLGGRYHSLVVNDFSYPINFVWTPITIVKILTEFLPELDPRAVLERSANTSNVAPITANSSPEGNYLIWGRDNGFLLSTAEKLALSLSLDNSKDITLRNKFDNVNSGGLFQTQIVSGAKGTPFTTIDSADVVLVEDSKILESFDVLATTRPGASIILISNKIKNSVEEDVIAKLPITFKQGLARNHNKLVVVDFSIVEELDKDDSTKGFSADFLAQVAFWKVAFPDLNGFVVNKLLQANGNGFELLGAVLDKFVNTVNEKEALKVIEVLPEWIDLEEGKGEELVEETEEATVVSTEEVVEVASLPFFPSETSIYANPRNQAIENEDASQGEFIDLAKKITFPEAYETAQVLRPDLPVKNFVVKVQENKRLTPSEYSRNIFHIEFDTTGTGLTYDIGEALGIHGRNNSKEVESFLSFYGVDGDSLIEVANKEVPTLVETRSARQILAEGLDFLGKPPKRFYESLAPFASEPKEKAKLESLAGASGAEELKKRQDVDFCTYTDILEEFPSARPSFAELVKIIAPLKRREYSIASSQKIHPNAVHLLIVVVDWVDPKGRKRFGHCSKYLSDLKIGDELVVSVKPSVMKLPPLSTQPIIMSGLGTGLAPFKAFIEEKIWQKQQGMEIGEIYLFMGSRHKKEEYLYGELWEAYKDAGVLTHIGAAFSRDQPEKIYIQDKIRDHIEELTDAVVAKEGSFYLCGPTWPVPDITACLEDIVANGAKRAGVEIKDVAHEVEEMKESGRYILEVY